MRAVRTGVGLLFMVFVAFGQSVSVGVVEQRVVPITPWKLLGAKAQMGVGHKFRPLHMARVEDVSIDPTQGDTGQCHYQ